MCMSVVSTLAPVSVQLLLNRTNSNTSVRVREERNTTDYFGPPFQGPQRRLLGQELPSGSACNNAFYLSLALTLLCYRYSPTSSGCSGQHSTTGSNRSAGSDSKLCLAMVSRSSMFGDSGGRYAALG